MSKKKREKVDYKRLFEDAEKKLADAEKAAELQKRLREEEQRLREEEQRRREAQEEAKKQKEETERQARLREEDQSLREHAEQIAQLVSVRSVLDEKPPLLETLGTPSFENPDSAIEPSTSQSATTHLLPPDYIPAITCKDDSSRKGPTGSTQSDLAPIKLSAAASVVVPIRSSSKSAGSAAESSSRAAAARAKAEKEAYENAKAGLPSDWRPVMSRKDNMQVAFYQHIPTGLLHNLRPTGKGIPLLKRWEINDFASHLLQAEDAKIQNVLIWPLIMECKVSGWDVDALRGRHHTELMELVSERTLERRVDKTVYRVLTAIIWRAFEDKDVDGWKVRCEIGAESQEPRNRPGNSSRRKVDGLFEVYAKRGDYQTRVIACIINETKQDYKFPCLKSECRNGDEEYRHDLIKFYLDTETGTETKVAEHNVLIQIRTYLGTYHRRFGMITTLNTWTFVRLDEDGILYVSPTFQADKQPEGLDWCLVEVLLRFIFAAIGEYKIGNRPNDMMARRPEFVRRYYEQDPDLDKKDQDKGWGWSPAGNQESSSSSSSSSSAAQGHKAAGTNRNKVIGPVCWADMEDPRRNADESNLTWEESFSELGALEGDAQPIGHGRSGFVYRKKFGDYDLAIKTFYLYQRRDEDEPTDEEIKSDLNNEAEFYMKNADIQGDLIPRFYGLRTLQVAVCLILEYIGPSYARFQKITKEQMKSALAGLSALHRRGILHGDVSLRNIVWNEHLKRAVWIDFTFSSSRLDSYNDADWSYWTREELNKIEEALNSRVGTS